MFEKLILGTLLSIFGFRLINPEDSSQNNKVFWLSSRGDKRESDATLLYKPGVECKNLRYVYTIEPEKLIDTE